MADGDESPDDEVAVHFDCKRRLRKKFKTAAIADDNSYAEELAQLLRFRDRRKKEFRKADLSRRRNRER